MQTIDQPVTGTGSFVRQIVEIGSLRMDHDKNIPMNEFDKVVKQFNKMTKGGQVLPVVRVVERKLDKSPVFGVEQTQKHLDEIGRIVSLTRDLNNRPKAMIESVLHANLDGVTFYLDLQEVEDKNAKPCTECEYEWKSLVYAKDLVGANYPDKSLVIPIDRDHAALQVDPETGKPIRILGERKVKTGERTYQPKILKPVALVADFESVDVAKNS